DELQEGVTWALRTRFKHTFERFSRSEEHTSELQSHLNLVCRLLLEKKTHLHTPTHTARPRPTATHSHTHRHRDARTYAHAHAQHHQHPDTSLLMVFFFKGEGDPQVFHLSPTRRLSF